MRSDMLVDEELRETIESMLDILVQCSEQSWDGNGASAVTSATFAEAMRLLSQVPRGVLMPEPTPEPSGEIGFAWRSGSKSFVMSVRERQIIFSGLLGDGKKIQGTAALGSSLPESLSRILLLEFAAQPSTRNMTHSHFQ